MIIIYFIICAVSLMASTIGAICGIGGGVIIKPVLDATGVIGVSAASFMSGCTVLVMSTYSVVKSGFSGKSEIKMKVATPLAIGAAIGGIAGQKLFQLARSSFENQDKVGAIQAGCLLIITIGTLIFTLLKHRIRTKDHSNVFLCLIIGLFLGIMSSFLGIGGGPINLIVFFYFFSMSVKAASQNSLYVIFFSQATSVLLTVITGKVPEVSILMIVLMSCFGLLGGIIGGKINHRISEEKVKSLFLFLMMIIIIINIYNILRYL